MLILLTTIHVIVSLFLILVVLLQQGKGADLSVFGGGSTQAVFGARGAATLLHKLTVGGFIAFVITTIGIGLMTTGKTTAGSVMSDVPAAVEETMPAEDTPAQAPAAAAGDETEPPAAAPTDDAGDATGAAENEGSGSEG